MEEIPIAKLHRALSSTFDRVLRSGPVLISRNGRDYAVLISGDDFREMTDKINSMDERG